MLVMLVMLAAAPSFASKPKKPAATAAPAIADGTDVSTIKTTDTATLMQRAVQLQNDLEYDQVLPLVSEVLSRDPAVDIALDAYVLQGSCLAIIGNAVDAELPFRRLLRGRPQFDLPTDTAPKIMGVFRKVQAEEKAIADQMRELQRARLVGEMQLSGAHPKAIVGGTPVRFNYELKDPSLSASVRVRYKKHGEPAFSSLALSRDAQGRWRGEVPAEWTVNADGAQMLFVVESFDNEGTLVSAGSNDAPMVAEISPGTIDRSSPPPLPPWSIVLAAAVTTGVAAAAVGAGVGVLTVQAQYDEQAQLSVRTPQPANELHDKRQLGELLAITTNSLLVAAGVGVLATGVAAVFFTDWAGRSDVNEGDAAPAAVAKTP